MSGSEKINLAARVAPTFPIGKCATCGLAGGDNRNIDLLSEWYGSSMCPLCRWQMADAVHEAVDPKDRPAQERFRQNWIAARRQKGAA